MNLHSPRFALVLLTACFGAFLTSRSFADTKLVGTLPADVSVDNKGTASVTIPLQTAPGRAGLEPKLALTYSSAAGNGSLGIGWSVSTGYPHSITRGRTILARDGVVKGINFTSDDKLYLDGKRLLCVSGTNGLPGSTYRTEVDSFMDITAYGTGSKIDGFRVMAKDGTMYCFGGNVLDRAGAKVYTAMDGYNALLSGFTSDMTSQVVGWKLKWVEDAVGNYVEFVYGGSLPDVPSAINYTGNRRQGVAPGFKVKFSSTWGRPDLVQVHYNAGYYEPMDSYLNSVEVRPSTDSDQATSNPLRSFQLNYIDFLNDDGSTKPGLLKLKEVVRQEYTGTTISSTKTTLAWGADTTLAPAPVKFNHGTLNSVFSEAAHGDFNGDGRDDLLLFDLGPYSMQYLYQQPPGARAMYIAYSGQMDNLVPVESPFGSMDGVPTAIMTGDFNGDGKTDLIWCVKGHGWYVALSTGSGFATPQLIYQQPAPYTIVVNGITAVVTTDIQCGMVGDFNGDGLDDLLIVSHNSRDTFSGTQFGAATQVAWTDLTGDDIVDRYLEYSVPGGCETTTTVSLPGAHWFLLTNNFPTGNLSFSTQEIPNAAVIHPFTTNPVSLEVVDLDNDGKADLLATELHYPASPAAAPSPVYGNISGAGTETHLYSLRNMGGGIFVRADTGISNEMPLTGPDATGVADPTGFHKMIGDVNGDGLPDIVYLKMSYDFVAVHTETSPSWVEYQPHGEWRVALSKGDGTFDDESFAGFNAYIPIGDDTVKTFNRREGQYIFTSVNDWNTLPTDFPDPGSYNLTGLDGFDIWGVHLIDVNGDGKKDFVFYAKGKGWYCLLAGVPDVPDPNGPYTNWGFDWAHPIALPWGQTNPSDLPWRSLTMDLDGNGREDLVFIGPDLVSDRGTGGDPLWGKHNSTIYASLTPSTDANRLVSVTNGLGSTTTIAYRPTTDASVYTPGVPVSYPIQESRRPQYVASDIYKDSGSTTPDHFGYQYSGNYLDLSGRGGLGFHSFITLDTQTNMFKYQFLTQSFPMTGLTAREQTYRYWLSNNGQNSNFRLISSHDNTVVFDEVVKSSADSTPWGTVYPFISQAVESRWENADTAHFTFAATGPIDVARPESLFPQTRPAGAHITITAQSWFDQQDLSAAPQTTLPNPFKPSDTDPNNGTPSLNKAPITWLYVDSGTTAAVGSTVTIRTSVYDPDTTSIGRHLWFKSPGVTDWQQWDLAWVNGDPHGGPGAAEWDRLWNRSLDQAGVWQFMLECYDPAENGNPFLWGNRSYGTVLVGGATAPAPQITIPTGSDYVVGFTNYTDIQNLGLPRQITCGNLTQLKTDFGDGFKETVVTAYKAPIDGLTGLVDTVTTTVDSTGYGTETAPVKSYAYAVIGQAQTPLVASETVTATDAALTYTTTYGHDTLGRVNSTSITGDSQTIGSYTTSSVPSDGFDARFDLPTTSLDTYNHPTNIVYHDQFGKPISVTDVNGAKVTTQYDALDRAIVVRDELKSLETDTTYAWTTSDASGWTKTQTVTPPDGVSGLTLTSTYAVQSTTKSTINTGVRLKPTVTTYFDRLGRAIRTIKDGFNGHQTVSDTVYNYLGQAVAVSNPYATGSTPLWTKTTYDALGRVVTVTAPNGTVTSNIYDGRVTQVTVAATDRDAQTNTTYVDAKGRTIAVWNADNAPALSLISGSDAAYTADVSTASIAYGLDGFGRMRATTLKGQTQTITAAYDALGRQTELNDPDKGHWYYINNALGQVVRQQDANTNVTTSSFDHLGRPLTRTTTEPNNGPVETANWYYYDTDANLATYPHLVALGAQGWIGAPQREESTTVGAPGFAAPITSTVHYYDAKGRSTIDLAAIDGKYFYTYTDYTEPNGADYNRVSHVRHYWRPANHEAASDEPYLWQDFGYTYNYDTNSYLTSLSDSLGRTWWQADPTSGYDYLGRAVLVQKGNGPWTQRTYNPTDGTLTGLATTDGAAQIQNLTFTYDGLGNLTSRIDGLRGTATNESFGYDNLNRLTNSSKQGATAYAANGNITNKPNVSGTQSAAAYVYDLPQPHAVHKAFGYSMTYDANGNLATRTNPALTETWNIKWAGFDKPRWMAKTSTTPAKTVGSEFSYNAARSRVMQLEFDQMDTAPTHYTHKRIYALGSTLEINYDNQAGAGTAPTWKLNNVRIYVPGPDGVIGAREFEPGAASVSGEKALVYHYDHLGSIEAITPAFKATSTLATDDTGKPGLYSEDAWGQRRDPNSWNGAPTTTDQGGHTSLTPRGYTGHEMLDDLGLVHMNGRIYDPLLGRMLSADLIVSNPGSLQSYNRYSYVNNNPLTLVDPSGFGPEDPESKSTLKDQLKWFVSLFIPDNTSAPGSSQGERTPEDQAVRDGAKAGFLQASDSLEKIVKVENTIIKSTPILGQAVTGTELLTGKNPLDPTGSTSASRTDAGMELAAGAAVGVVAEKLAPVISRTAGKIATALKGDVDTLVAPAAKGVKDEMVTVYRGVHAEHPALTEALQGRAAPIGGHADPVLHNAFDNRSIFTSWTTDKATAVNFATGNGPGGVLLKDSVPSSTLTISPDVFKEFEVLRVGPVAGATPIILSQ